MEVMIDYQQIVDLAAKAISIGLPIGLIFGLAGKVTNFFLSMVFGKERVDL